MSPEDPERLYVALGHNRGDFQWDAPANHTLIGRHLLWCLDQRERGWLLPSRVPADNLTIFATTSREELERALDLDPLVVAGVRRYAITGCQPAEQTWVPQAHDPHWLRS
ncbi:YciI family protein [Actinophytocola sp. KF-1]